MRWGPVWVLAWVLAVPGGASAQGASFEARVTRVSDGDSLWVRPLDGGAPRRVRLQGIDAPEICQPGGRAARDALAARLERATVTVRPQAEDDYGRQLAVIVWRGEDINRWLVREGWAWAYRWRSGEGPYARDEQLARRAGRGVFADPLAEEPRAFRRRHGPCETARSR